MSYEAKISGKAPYSNVNNQGEMKASRSLNGKFYGHMRIEDGMRSNPFNQAPHNGVRIAGYTERDYGNLDTVYHDKGTSKVFVKK